MSAPTTDTRPKVALHRSQWETIRTALLHLACEKADTAASMKSSDESNAAARVRDLCYEAAELVDISNEVAFQLDGIAGWPNRA